MVILNALNEFQLQDFYEKAFNEIYSALILLILRVNWLLKYFNRALFCSYEIH